MKEYIDKVINEAFDAVVAKEQGHTWSALIVPATNAVRTKILAAVDAAIDALEAKGVKPPTA